jgi:DNA-binding NarL/FixJ family response regulator
MIAIVVRFLKDRILDVAGCGMSETRLLISDDQYLTRAGLRAMARNAPDLNVAGEAHDAQGTVEAAVKLAPDIVLVNLRTLELGDLKMLVDEINTTSPVIVLRSQNSRIGVMEALHANAAGFADIDALESEFKNMITLVQRGFNVCITSRETPSQENLDGHAYQIANSLQSQFSGLTAREIEVLRLIAAGMTNNQIAAELYVAESTVKKHASRVMKKMGVSSRISAALQFLPIQSRGLIERTNGR